MTRATMNTFTLPSSAPQAGWCSPCAAHLRPPIRRKTTKVNARLPVSSDLGTLSKELPTRNAEERQHLIEQVLHRHALRVGLCVFQQIFEVLVVDRFLELLEGSAARMNLGGDFFTFRLLSPPPAFRRVNCGPRFHTPPLRLPPPPPPPRPRCPFG